MNRLRQSLRQSGVTTVEFAVAGFAVLVIILATIDFSRIFFTMSVLDEVTRRGARVAVVCPVNDPAIPRRAVFGNGGGQSTLIKGLTSANIDVDYLGADGVQLAAPGGANYADIEYIRVSIQNFNMQTFVPLLAAILPMPPFATTLPAESLGRIATADVACT